MPFGSLDGWPDDFHQHDGFFAQLVVPVPHDMCVRHFGFSFSQAAAPCRPAFEMDFGIFALWHVPSGGSFKPWA